ncbi:DUF1624 domain-containing protein [Panacibacter ginsenosidivorans]|uniref:DUF1624 domain-containing protein n=1 Tax=Panacibacter ginsenosidivorans TaxID=1813871 RepID=A0A5B8VDL6_9BACT|nr:heparan-alpha-glucosaminide N-acetyltransferase domain-containing protein [Panacibacter ginsenosidivorans]QEC69564.1 DUF1624 domain-containing protein [Panacibacter ginsenosidivorans]
MTVSPTPTKQRVHSIDILRGLVMLIMALDHVRDFFHIHGMDDTPTNLATTTPFLFFTRWITHFCAPTFVFLSGVSAFIAGQRKTKKELSSFLIRRGLWLILAEITIITLALTYDPLYHKIILQVIWAIGFSMIILGLLTRTSMTVIVITGLLLVIGHNIFDYIRTDGSDIGSLLTKAFIASGFNAIPLGDNHVILMFYTALPWAGVMLLGYAFGTIYRSYYEARRRKVLILFSGLTITILFILLRFINMYGDPAQWSVQKDATYTLLSFLNTTKYPPSLMYLCMTIGPALIILALTETAQNRIAKILMIYGRVPFFYYMLHFFIIHTLLVILFYVSGYGTKDIADPNIPFNFRPLHFGYDLGTVYLIWFCVIASLYFPCKWFNKYKTTHSQWWLSYV